MDINIDGYNPGIKKIKNASKTTTIILATNHTHEIFNFTIHKTANIFNNITYQ